MYPYYITKKQTLVVLNFKKHGCLTNMSVSHYLLPCTIRQNSLHNNHKSCNAKIQHLTSSRMLTHDCVHIQWHCITLVLQWEKRVTIFYLFLAARLSCELVHSGVWSFGQRRGDSALTKAPSTVNVRKFWLWLVTGLYVVAH